MNRNLKITRNGFFEIFADSLTLYEHSLIIEQKNNDAFSKSCFLSVNYALEAAANSFLKSIDISDDLSRQVERFSTLDKFDFVLQWHTGKKLPKGVKVSQDIKKIIKDRNEMVHPKIIDKVVNVETSFDNSKLGAFHKETANEEDCGIVYVNSKIAFNAIKSLVEFLNEYIINWWGITTRDVSLFLFPVWHASMRPMYESESLRTVLRHKNSLGILFLDIDGIERQFKDLL